MLGQNYHIQDATSGDDTVEILKDYGDRISWRSEPDDGQSDAINKGFGDVDCDIMAYLNSDDTLLAGALASIAGFFAQRPDVDFVYGHRIFIDYAGSEIGRRFFRRMTARHSNTPAMCRRRPCSGAVAYRTRSDR